MNRKGMLPSAPLKYCNKPIPNMSDDTLLSEAAALVNDDVIACHEAGHLIAHRFCLRGIEKVTIDFIDGKRGVFTKSPPDTWTDFEDFLTILAGPRAQISLRHDSVEQHKLEKLKSRIIQPKDTHLEIPSFYNNTGWGPDVRAVYEILLLPGKPVWNLDFTLTVRIVYEEVEKRLIEFFANSDVRKAVEIIAAELVAYRLIDGATAESLVESTGILKNHKLQAFFKWD